MMVQNPQQWVESMADAGVDQYTFHIEPVLDKVDEISRKVREAGMKVGLAIKPGTPLDAIEKYIPIADMILVMTVEPGFGGQKFMVDQMPKVKWLRDNYPTLDIEVDGGVGTETIQHCADVSSIKVHLIQNSLKKKKKNKIMDFSGWCKYDCSWNSNYSSRESERYNIASPVYCSKCNLSSNIVWGLIQCMLTNIFSYEFLIKTNKLKFNQMKGTSGNDFKSTSFAMNIYDLGLVNSMKHPVSEVMNFNIEIYNKNKKY